jgi:hypothetical protein
VLLLIELLSEHFHHLCERYQHEPALFEHFFSVQDVLDLRRLLYSEVSHLFSHLLGGQFFHEAAFDVAFSNFVVMDSLLDYVGVFNLR